MSALESSCGGSASALASEGFCWLEIWEMGLGKKRMRLVGGEEGREAVSGAVVLILVTGLAG